MKKFLNSPQTLLEESFDGFVAARADIIVACEERKFLRRRTLKPGKVALISGAARGTNRCMPDLSGTACWTPLALGKFSRRQRQTRCSPPSKLSIREKAWC
jgi:hypothetical protein